MRFNKKNSAIISGLVIIAIVVGISTYITYNIESDSIFVKIATDKLIGGLPLFVTLHQNYLENENIAYGTDFFPTASLVAESLLAKQHDVGGPISLVDISIIESKNPGQFKLFSVYAEPSTSPISYIIVKKDSPYQSMDDLRGTNMAIGPGVTPEFLAKSFIKKFYSIDEITLVVLPPSSWIQALESGQVDSVYAIEPFATIAMQKGIARTIFEGAESHVIDPMPIVGIAFTKEFIENNPEEAAAIVAAVDKATNLIRTNPDAARAALSAYTELDESISGKINLASSYSSAELDDIKDIIQNFADLVYEEGYMDKKIDVTNLLYQN